MTDGALIFSGEFFPQTFSTESISLETNVDAVCFFELPGEPRDIHHGATRCGFLAIVRPFTGLVATDTPFELLSESETKLAEICTANPDRIGFLLSNWGERPIPDGIIDHLERATSDIVAVGRIEQARTTGRYGGVVTGWTAALPGVNLALVSRSGHMVNLSQSIRWHCEDFPDEANIRPEDYGTALSYLQGWRPPAVIGDPLYLVALDGDACNLLETINWTQAPRTPLSFARWAFSIQSPLDRFSERLAQHDGPILDSLIKDLRSRRASTQPEVTVYGETVRHPKCTIIIAIYGRYDMMFNQLLEMSEDEELRQNAELIFVVDDPRLLVPLKQQAWSLFKANHVPFKIVSAGDNRGFSGANNLGVSVSNAPLLLLLNSDVIPVESGWLGKMMSAIQGNPQIGIVGARLTYPNGSIQHDGMSFVWNSPLNAHVNRHPRMGFEANDPSPVPTQRVAVTGACLMIQKDVYLRLGGLDEGFLIGDFEDSDLCLKVLQAGLEIVCVEDLSLVHLGRQSIVGIGRTGFRDRVVRYNAARHEARWHSVLTGLAGDSDITL